SLCWQGNIANIQIEKAANVFLNYNHDSSISVMTGSSAEYVFWALEMGVIPSWSGLSTVPGSWRTKSSTTAYGAPTMTA
ncbi:MAG: hypothetical protein SGARI_008110, partial [Bacillariaceae sp.]